MERIGVTRLWSSPLLLLLATGLLLGVSLPLTRMAAQAGLPGIFWPFVISLGPVLVLGTGLAVTGALRRPDAHRMRYFFGTTLVSNLIPNLLIFAVIPKVGAGYAGIMFTLSPVLTLTLSLLTGVRRPNWLGMTGIGLGFAGALLVALSRGGLGEPAPLAYVLAALCIPVSLAIGNIYRTMDWPPGAGPIELAVGSHSAGLAALFALSFAAGGGSWATAAASAPGLILAQIVASAAMFAVFFRLQAVGGPVYLSQIGYVAAAVGLAAGTVLFGEQYSVSTWIGAALIVAGVVATTKAQT